MNDSKTLTLTDIIDHCVSYRNRHGDLPVTMVVGKTLDDIEQGTEFETADVGFVEITDDDDDTKVIEIVFCPHPIEEMEVGGVELDEDATGLKLNGGPEFVVVDTPIHVDKDVAIGSMTGKPKYSIMKYFEAGHLPPHLQEVVAPFRALAENIAVNGKDPAETTVALRKLLEAKDAAVRSVL